jgi:hypothetical protein
MTVFAGDEIFAADVNELIDRQNTVIFTGDSSTWSGTEASAMSITISAISGAKYKIVFEGRVSTDIAADAAFIRVREDSLSGNQLNYTNVYLPTTTGNGWQARAYAEWTATSTGNKTFVITGQRSIGTGVAHRIRAAGNGPAYLYVDRIAN